jgi:hypothetical protein
MIDFDKEFSSFCSSDSSAIKDIYKIIPTLSNGQIKTLNMLRYYIEKYQLVELEKVLQDYLSTIKGNKNLNFFSSMTVKNLLKAYTLEELTKGIKVNSSTQKEE